MDISVLHFHILEIGNWVDSDQSTGRLIQVPNAKILTDPIANYTSEFPFLWHEVPVVLTFESDWRRAKTILLRMVTEASAEMSERAAEFLRKRPSRTSSWPTRRSGLSGSGKRSRAPPEFTGSWWKDEACSERYEARVRAPLTGCTLCPIPVGFRHVLLGLP